MKDTIKTSRTAGYLEKIFRAVNADWFGGELEEPIITIQSTPRAYGHVTVSKVWKRKGEQRHELNIGAETLQRPIEEVVATIVHEAVHLYNLAHGVQDCSRGNTYHNKRFKEEAERRGLVIFHHPTYGWTITEPSEALIDYIIAQGWAEIQMNRGGGWTPPPSAGGKTGNGGTQTGGSTEPPKRSSTRKYVCPCCKQSDEERIRHEHTVLLSGDGEQQDAALSGHAAERHCKVGGSLRIHPSDSREHHGQDLVERRGTTGTLKVHIQKLTLSAIRGRKGRI